MSEPRIVYPPELPVSAARDEIAAAIRDHQVVIVAGATGSGKTTQLPKICLELGRERIAHTQPRRIAARTIAERVASELGVELGAAVGYKVRFTDQVSADTRIALMTDGILLNEIHRDRMLRRYDTIIVDEAHERSLNVDFLLGYLVRLLPKRPDLKVVVTSATIDPESFARHFSDDGRRTVPIIEVSGRTYPVEVRYRPHDERAEDDVDGLLAALRELDAEPAGDVLVFLPGEAEIRDAMDAVRGMHQGDARPTEVLPLYGRLSAAEQHRVFEPSAVAGVRRRVVLATNVAETSLTVPGIRYVVDTGTARISRYSARSKVQRLPIEPVSQASAQQRSGRAGRTSPGVAIRLYAEDDFAKRPEFTEPEILRTQLASVILQLLALGLGDIERFPFLTKPDSRGVKAAFDLLVELRAITRADSRGSQPRLTDIGRRLARLPIDPRFARMLVEAEQQGVAGSVLPIVAGLSIQDVRERPSADEPAARREAADRLHGRFTDPTSDFLTLLNLWNHLQEQQRELGSSAFRRLCRAEMLNYVRVREWFDVHRQLRQLTGAPRETGGTSGTSGAHDPGLVHRAILAGLLSHIGILDTRSLTSDTAKSKRKPLPQYRGARGASFAIFPGSGLRKATPDAVMAAELVETSRLFARTVAVIDPAWAEELAGDLARRSLSDPHWSKDAGAAVAAEKVTLFGVEIVPRRRVQLARIDRELARELFVRHALVQGEWDLGDKRLSGFERRNLELRRRLEKVEERERRRDILAGDEAVFAFYDARIPADVVDTRSFEKWWRGAIERTPRLLDLSEADLAGDAARSDERDFPGRWRQGDQVLSLAYRFEPGAEDDGVSVVVPLALLAQLSPEGFDWQVPGMRDELITALIRALPKAIRRHVVPAADWAATLSSELAGAGPESHDGFPPDALRTALAARIRRVANQPVTADDFDLDRVPGHLQMSFRAVDGRGRVAGTSRDLPELQQRLAGRARDAVSRSLSGGRRPGPGGVPSGASGGASGDASGGAPLSGEIAAPTGAALSNARGAGDLGGGRGAAAGSRAPGSAGSSRGQRRESEPPTPTLVERTGITSWDLGALPDVVDTRVPGGIVRGYPALVDEKDAVALRIEATPARAAQLTHAGVRRLLLLAVPSTASYVLDHLTASEKLALAASPYPSARVLVEDARVALADAAMARTEPRVRTPEQFARVRDAFSTASANELFPTVSLLAGILSLHRDVERAVRDQNSMTLLAALGDVKGQVAGLVFPGFVSRTGLDRLAHLPRYLRGALVRVQGLADNPGRDRQRLTEIERATALFTEAGGTIPPAPDAPAHLVRARWLLEEYRVSLFAQHLGTAEPVSIQRIVKALAP